jgi:hypothetical protein
MNSASYIILFLCCYPIFVIVFANKKAKPKHSKDEPIEFSGGGR